MAQPGFSARGHYVSALCLIGLAALTSVGGTAVATGLAVFGMTVAIAGWLRAREAYESELANAAFAALVNGRMAEAEALLARVPPLERGSVARAVAFQRGLIALLRGDARAATIELEPALAEKTRIETRTHERMQRAAALGVRAVAFAALGEQERAEADARAAEESPEAPPAAIARASLARAIGLAKKGDGAALGDLLARRGATILTSVTPRERALVRALRKLGRARGTGAYREAGVIVEPSVAPHELAGWVGAIVPEAAAFTVHDPSAAAEARHAPLPRAEKTSRFPYAVAAIGSLAAVACTLAFVTAIRAGSLVPSLPATVFIVALAAIWPLVAYVKTRTANVTAARMLAAQRALATGDEAGASQLLASLPSRSLVLEGTAALCIAEAAERRGDFAGCRTVCVESIRRLGAQPSLDMTGREVQASLIAQDGAAAAAMGDIAAANAALAHLETTHGGWGGLAAARFRIQLLRAMRAHDVGRAQRVAKERAPDLVVAHRDEVLAELAFGATEDVERELAQDPMLRTWVDAITQRVRVAPPGASREPELFAEEPQEAERRAMRR